MRVNVVPTPPPRRLLEPALPGFEGVRRAYDEVAQAWLVHVQPGEFYVTRNDEILSTVLGSCVSVCIRDSRLGFGGMNHFLLPGDDGHVNGDVLRYGSYALERLINELVKYGGMRERFEVKLFGGGRVINGTLDIGRSNVDFVHRYLADEQLTIASESVGGTVARRVRYHPLTGKVMMMQLAMDEGSQAERAAQERAAQVKQQDKNAGKVILF